MIIDFHTHIFPPDIRQNRSAYFKNEPAFDLLYRSPGSRLVGADTLIETMDEHGVDKSVVFGFPWQTEKFFKLNNDYIMAAVQRYPDRLVGFGCFDTLQAGAAAETERCLKNGLSGIGELGFYNSGIDAGCVKSLEPVMAVCRGRDVPVMIHTNEPVGHAYPGKTPVTLLQLDALVQAFPENTIVLAHWGGGLLFFSLLKKKMKARLARVYFDTAASPYLYDAAIYRVAVDILGPEKILFGTDFPLLAPSRYFRDMEKAGLTQTEIHSICYGNARRLLMPTKETDIS
ncbi:MAG: amidohydrolase [Deltaproteobacteria bacterium]|nr:MAG: amidohydrolase [Deltaproteobacteria bacterium]